MIRLADAWSVRDPVATATHDYAHVYLGLEARLSCLLRPEDHSAWRILDLGCGYHHPLVSLWQGTAGHVTGIDIRRTFLRDGRWALVRETANTSGLLRAVKAGTVRHRYYRDYYRALEALSGRSFDFAALDLRTYDGFVLPLESDSCDAVVSNAVLEHVSDVVAFAAEVRRVLRRGGWLDCVWHNFFCPSGSHLGPRVEVEDPWGHVLGRRPTKGLNRKGPEEMRAAVARELHVESLVAMDKWYRTPDDPEYSPEGLDALTPALRAQLSAYPTELLTTRGYLIQATKA